MPRDHDSSTVSADQDPSVPDNAIEIRDLSKIYASRHGQPEKRALDTVSLEIPRGSFFGLLGPNGAGKSTLINIMAGLVTKTSGTVRIWGNDIDTAERAARLAIGVVPQELNLDPFFTPRELLDVQAGLYGVPKSERRTDEILHLVGLTDKADSYARTLSGGMRRRLLVAKAMVHAPPILVLDEPTAGVDIELRQQLWEQVKLLNEQGTTILLTTHYLEEAEELCDRIAIISQGTVAACEPKKTLLQRLDSKALYITVRETLNVLPPALAALGAEIVDETRLVVRYRPSETVMGEILEAIHVAGLSVLDLSTEEADLEDIFLQLTSQPDAAAHRANA
jgi:ABC-2 type transport system ATP-binding protein